MEIERLKAREIKKIKEKHLEIYERGVIKKIPFTDITIKYCGDLSIRAYNALTRAGKTKVVDVKKLIDDGELTTIKNISVKTEQEITGKINAFIEKAKG